MKHSKYPIKKWDVSIIELENDVTFYKVTRRISELEVPETKIFDSKEKAKEQFEQWLK
ncbi:hypothetical protein HQ489_00035 [Candidatus Woesearchaeota archaeon]|nr:hypothetical protein [Candidatus Woesearchaeota archaeon]